MQAPPLDEIAASVSRRAPSPATIAALTSSLIDELGADRVSTVEAARLAASTDFAHLSPILTAALPQRYADVIVRPTTTEELITAVRLAHRHQTPIVPRGKGTGNYGQAVPLAAGMVIDLTAMNQILEVGEGWLRARAGATFVALESAARRHGQEIAMWPTTIGSTIGGFIGGGAGGVGSIEHGWLWDGFVLTLDVVTCPPGESALRVHGARCVPYLHAYGVTGIITTATVRLAPARDWLAVLASFPSGERAGAILAGQALLRLDLPPRLVSLDDPELVATYPPDDAMPAGRYSLRAIIDASVTDTVRTLIAEHGGRIESTPPDGAAYLSTLSFNHVTLRAKRSRPELCHLQVGGEALITRGDEVRAALPGAMLHLDGLRTYLDSDDPKRGRQFAGLLLSEFQDTRTLYNGIARLRELGVHVVDPHTWLLGGPGLDTIREVAATNDPDGLLNPGKLV